ncbi:hypothetical protein KRX54_00290 [Actinomycetaceae bacterium TAE3-ERU4]|nr:hypothetical protein [Actinomycetaceae bacterium TAE3-ERU4]
MKPQKILKIVAALCFGLSALLPLQISAPAIALDTAVQGTLPTRGTYPLPQDNPDHSRWTVVDEVGILKDKEAVISAFDNASYIPRIRLVILSSTTSPEADAKEWLKKNNFGRKDIYFFLFYDSHKYAFVSGKSLIYTDEELDTLEAGFRKYLKKGYDTGNWSEEMIAFANSLKGSSALIPTGDYSYHSDRKYKNSSSDSSWFNKIWSGIVLLLSSCLPVLILYLLVRPLKRKYNAKYSQHRTGYYDNISLDELEKIASNAMMTVDNGLKDARDELEFARAQFGMSQTDELADLIYASQDDIDYGWEQLNQANNTDNEAEKRRILISLLEMIRKMDKELAEKQSVFEQLRTTQAQLPQEIPLMRERIEEMSKWAQSAQEDLKTFRVEFPNIDLTSLTQVPDRLLDLQRAAQETLQQAEDKLASYDSAEALHLLHLAQRTYAQGKENYENLKNAHKKLQHISQLLVSSISSISKSIEDAHRLAPNDLGIQTVVDEAKQQIEIVKEARLGNGDPLAALNTITDTEKVLDGALEPYREQEENQQRALKVRLDQQEAANALVERAQTYISMNRGAVSYSARMELEQAQRAREEFNSQISDSGKPELSHLTSLIEKMNTHARRAMELAQADVENTTQYTSSAENSANGGFFEGLYLGGILNDYSRHSWGTSTPSWGNGNNDDSSDNTWFGQLSSNSIGSSFAGSLASSGFGGSFGSSRGGSI